MEKNRVKSGLLPAMVLAIVSGSLLLVGCETTPDESYKKSQMTRPLDYPPDLVAPVTNERFSVPPPGSTPISTPVSVPETPRAPRKPANKRGGHSH